MPVGKTRERARGRLIDKERIGQTSKRAHRVPPVLVYGSSERDQRSGEQNDNGQDLRKSASPPPIENRQDNEREWEDFQCRDDPTDNSAAGVMSLPPAQESGPREH